MKLIVTSEKDLASQTIKEALLSYFSFEKLSESFEDYPIYLYKSDIMLVTSKTDLVYLSYLDSHFEAEFYIFASRHSSKSKLPALLVHTPGNWTEENKLGGNARSLAISNPHLMRLMLLRLKYWKDDLNLDNYLLSMEVTHHGPTNLKRPVTFIEIGSSPEEWANKEAAKAVAFTIMESIENLNQKNKVAIGFGGTHYCPSFNKLVLEHEISMGHIAPKYVIMSLDESVVTQAIEHNANKPDFAILDWKGLTASQREHIINILDGLSFPWIKNKNVV